MKRAYNKKLRKYIYIKCGGDRRQRCPKVMPKQKELLKQAFVQGYKCGRQESVEEIAKMRRIIKHMAAEVKRLDSEDRK